MVKTIINKVARVQAFRCIGSGNKFWILSSIAFVLDVNNVICHRKHSYQAENAEDFTHPNPLSGKLCQFSGRRARFGRDCWSTTNRAFIVANLKLISLKLIDICASYCRFRFKFSREFRKIPMWRVAVSLAVIKWYAANICSSVWQMHDNPDTNWIDICWKIGTRRLIINLKGHNCAKIYGREGVTYLLGDV